MSESTMKECPYCKETIQAEAVKCRYCKSDLRSGPGEPVYRDLPGRYLAGVAVYLSKTLGISVSLIRVLFVLATIFMAPLAIGVYIALWLIVPFRAQEQSVLEKLMAEAKCLYYRLRKKPAAEEGQAGSADARPSLTECNGPS